MGFRFRRTVRLGRGLRINLGTRGASVSVGRPGLSHTIGERGVTTTIGLPGTGLSYSTTQPFRFRSRPARILVLIAVLAVALIGFGLLIARAGG